MNFNVFWDQLLALVLPYLRVIPLALLAAFANEQVVEAIKTTLKGITIKGLNLDPGRWALVIALTIPAAVVGFLGMDFFRYLPGLYGADPTLVSGLTAAIVAWLSNMIHDKYRKPLDAK